MTHVGFFIASVLLWAGVAVELIAMLGLSVMHDVFDRLHYVSVAGFGVFLIGLAIVVHETFSLIGDKALATGVIVIALSPVLVHTTARSLRIRQFGDWREGIDGLAAEEGRRQ